MERIFIVYYDFGATSGNHAGMAHLARLIDKDVPTVRLIKSIPHHFPSGKYIARVYAVWLAFFFLIRLKKNDKVFFFEYLTKGTAFQTLTATWMRRLGIKIPIYALIHLSGQHLLELYPGKEYLQTSLRPVDKVFVFGSSLATFLRSIGFKKEILTTFHYVDTDFYKPGNHNINTGKLNVVCIGGLKRNFSLLKNIVSSLPEINFHILMGTKNLKPFFEGLKNVQLYSFISEIEMLHLMQTSDISLSVMEDTIGSNVITTSMAVGSIQVVSDVGSIRDYCNETNSFLCSAEQDYIMAIKKLDKDRELFKKMKEATLAKSNSLSHKAFISQFKEIV